MPRANGRWLLRIHGLCRPGTIAPFRSGAISWRSCEDNDWRGRRNKRWPSPLLSSDATRSDVDHCGGETAAIRTDSKTPRCYLILKLSCKTLRFQPRPLMFLVKCISVTRLFESHAPLVNASRATSALLSALCIREYCSEHYGRWLLIACSIYDFAKGISF